MGAVVGGFLKTIESAGVMAWTRETMPGRFGSSLPPAAIEWWTELMGATPKSTLQSYLRWVPGIDLTEDVKTIGCPPGAEGGKLGANFVPWDGRNDAGAFVAKGGYTARIKVKSPNAADAMLMAVTLIGEVKRAQDNQYVRREQYSKEESLFGLAGVR